MNTTFNISSPSSNEIFTVNEPSTLLNFVSYDFEKFYESCVELSRRFMKTGEYHADEVIALRNSISGCHKYYESNLRTVFDKIVVDCWIDFICRQSEMTHSALWSAFIDCETEFERVIFKRLSDYRCNRSVNQWENLIKLQEYARKKLDYVFGVKLDSASAAANRANCFDLMFAVAANEQGCDMSDIGYTKVYKAGQLPNSPFTLSSAAKEINRSVLSKIEYSDSAPRRSTSPMTSDKAAMDIFSLLEAHIPQSHDTIVNTIAKSLSSVPKNIYIPSNFKAMIDLEIDMIIENGGVIQRCKRCKEFYLRDADYDFDYCDKITDGAKTCIEIMGKSGSEKLTAISTEELSELKAKADDIYKEMTTRTGDTLTQRDFSEWAVSLAGIKNHVINGEATMEDFDAFVEYSKTISFSTKKSVSEQPKTQEGDSQGVVRPYQFQRVDRKELERQGLISKPSEDEPKKVTRVPAVSQPKPQPQPTVLPTPMKIIRGTPVSSPTYYEPNFEAVSLTQSVVSIPNGDETPRKTDEPTRTVEKAKPEPKRQSIDLSSAKKGNDDVKIYGANASLEDDVRIYGSRNAPENDVKIHSPRRKGKQNEPVRIVDEEEPRVSLSAPSDRDEIKPYQSHAVNAYKTAAFGSVSDDEPERAEPENNQMVDFSDVLKGIERKDGFGESIPVDADGVPLSHKTKHVMDAILKPSKASPSLRGPKR